MLTGKLIHALLFYVRFEDLTPLDLEWNGTPIFNPDGISERFFFVKSDFEKNQQTIVLTCKITHKTPFSRQ